MIENALNIARQLRQYGDINKSAALLNGILKVHPEDPNTNADMAILAFMHRDYTNAKKYAEKAFDETGENIVCYSLYLYALLKLGEIDKLKWIINTTSAQNVISGVFSTIKNPLFENTNDAIDIDLNKLGEAVKNAETEKAFDIIIDFLKKYGFHETAVATLAGLLTSSDRKIQAIFCFLISKHFNPQNPGIRYNLGVLFYYKSEYSLALHEYRKCIELDPNNALAHNNLASTYKHLKKPKLAIDTWQKCLQIRPNYETVRANLVNTLIELRRYEEAYEEIQIFEDLCPDSHLLHRVASQYFKNILDFETAKMHAQKYLSLQPNDPHALLLNGSIEEDLGNLSEAIEYYKKAVSLDPKHNSSMENLLQLSIQLKESALIEEIIDKCADVILKNPKLLILLSINDYISGNLDRSKANLAVLDSILKGSVASSMGQDYSQFIGPYYKYMTELLNFASINCDQSEIEAFVIGDSHSLSYSNTTFAIPDTKITLKSKIIFGTKMFHWAQDRNNRYQAILCKLMEDLEPNAKVIFSVGEIDCRSNEGFIKNFGDDHVKLYESVVEIVKKALRFISSNKPPHIGKIAFLSVPAPNTYEAVNSNIIPPATLIKSFNKILQEECKAHGFGFIDTYKHSAGADGLSNKQHHIDSHHLSPNIVDHIKTQIIEQLELR